MLVKINRQIVIKECPILPTRYYDPSKDDEIIKYPKVFACHIVTLPSKSFKGHQKLLAQQISLLVGYYGYNQLIFLGDTDIPWLKRLNSNKIFQTELMYLVDHKIGKRFNGAFKVDLDEMPIFIKNLSRLVRTNGIVPYVHFTDPGQNFFAHICQYGNLHITTTNKTADKKLTKIIDQTEFEYLPYINCIDKFSKNKNKGKMTIA